MNHIGLVSTVNFHLLRISFLILLLLCGTLLLLLLAAISSVFDCKTCMPKNTK